jgi:hypothetical protein
MTPLRWFLRHWYDVSLVIGIVILVVAASIGDRLSVLQRLSLANLGVIFLHFFEEFGFPGGFGKFANTLLNKGDGSSIDRHPLSQLSAMLGNWSFALLFYVPPIVFPDVMILGTMPMLFGAIGQMFAHGILNNVMLAKAGLCWGYNSGLATALFGHVPLAIAFYRAADNATPSDWALGFAYAVFAYLVVFRTIIMGGLEDKKSPFPFDATEMARFDRQYGVKPKDK